jgi:hypothetical protein
VGGREAGIEQEISEQGTLAEEKSEGTKDGGAPACRAFFSFSARAKLARAGWRTPSPIANPPLDRRFQRRTQSTGLKVTGVILKRADRKRDSTSLPSFKQRLFFLCPNIAMAYKNITHVFPFGTSAV